MEEPFSSEAQPILYQCPRCHQEVEAVAGQTAQQLHCPHCGEPFIIAAIDGSTDLPDERDEAHEKSQEDELDGLRIRQLSRMRRAAIRSQSYCIIAAAACLVGAVQFTIDAVRHFHRRGEKRAAVIDLFLAIILYLGTNHFVRDAIALHAETRKKELPEPTMPPDFSSLSDGRQHAKNLEELK